MERTPEQLPVSISLVPVEPGHNQGVAELQADGHDDAAACGNHGAESGWHQGKRFGWFPTGKVAWIIGASSLASAQPR